jgi:hypothetical protein
MREKARDEAIRELEKRKETMSDAERLAAEDELYRLRLELTGAKLAQEMLGQPFERTFRDWTEEDWTALDKALRSFMARAAE